jgi:hypothetical protein
MAASRNLHVHDFFSLFPIGIVLCDQFHDLLGNIDMLTVGALYANFLNVMYVKPLVTEDGREEQP